MRKLLNLLLALATLTAFARQESAPVQINYPEMPELWVNYMDIKPSPVIFTSEVNSQKKVVKESTDANKVNVTLQFPTLDEEWRMPYGMIYVYNIKKGYFDTIEITTWDDNGNPIHPNSWDITLPEGTYDFLTIFEKKKLNSFYGDGIGVYYIAENVTVFDGGTVTLNPEESTICLTMETTNPDGEKSRFTKYNVDENYNYEVIENGNIFTAFLMKSIICDGKCILTAQKHGVGDWIILGPHGESNPQEDCNFYVNNVSDRYLFREIKVMPALPDSDGIYMAVVECKGSIEGIYTNNPTYILDDSKVLTTPAIEKYPFMDNNEPDYSYSIEWREYSNDTMSNEGMRLSYVDSSVWKIWTSLPANPVTEDELYVAYSKELADAYIPIQNPWGTYYQRCTTSSGWYFPYATPYNTLTSHPYHLIRNNANGMTYPIRPFPGNQGFTSLLNKVKIETGASAPLLTSFIAPQFNRNTKEMDNIISFYYTGRLSECIGSSVALSNCTLMVDGEIVANNIDETTEWLMDNSNNKGVYEFTIDTDNFEIEGLSGGNHAVMNFSTLYDDSTPPSVTMLQLRGANEEVTQIFSNPSEGKLLLSAADFTICMGEANEDGKKNVWYEVSEPAKVIAWATPYGSTAEVIDEIELTVDPEAFYSPGFGAFYTGSLSDVKLTSPTGWYDLTIKVEDSAGNSQIQTVSPAFKIASMTGVESIAAEAGIKVDGNSIIAPAGSHVYTVSGFEVGLDNLPSGVYLVKTPGKTTKVIIR